MNTEQLHDKAKPKPSCLKISYFNVIKMRPMFFNNCHLKLAKANMF